MNDQIKDYEEYDIADHFTPVIDKRSVTEKQDERINLYFPDWKQVLGVNMFDFEKMQAEAKAKGINYIDQLNWELSHLTEMMQMWEKNYEDKIRLCNNGISELKTEIARVVDE